MKLGDIYRRIIEFGLKNELRSKSEVAADIKRARNDYSKLKGPAKKYFDRERLVHPYSDTRILCGDPKRDVRTIMVGVDMEGPELLLADRMRENGVPIDLVMTHHPEGLALSSLTEVMHLQKDVLAKFGIKPAIAKTLMDDRIGEVTRGLLATNHTRSVDIARHLEIAYMCAHTPADNHVANFLTKLFEKKKPKKIKDIMSLLYSIPEYVDAMKLTSGPALICGKEKSPVGKILVDMTGGTEGSKKVFARLSQAGVETIVGMHFSDSHYQNAKSENISLIVAGHISSDNLGLNLMLDNLEKIERLNIIPCSGFIRIKRV